jgi:hypothetical protein
LTHMRLHLKNVHRWRSGHNGGRPSKAVLVTNTTLDSFAGTSSVLLMIRIRTSSG